MADLNSVEDESVKNENQEQENEDDNDVVNNVLEGIEAPKKKKKEKKKKKAGKRISVSKIFITLTWEFPSIHHHVLRSFYN